MLFLLTNTLTSESVLTPASAGEMLSHNIQNITLPQRITRFMLFLSTELTNLPTNTVLAEARRDCYRRSEPSSIFFIGSAHPPAGGRQHRLRACARTGCVPLRPTASRGRSVRPRAGRRNPPSHYPSP